LNHPKVLSTAYRFGITLNSIIPATLETGGVVKNAA
jgi:hypothetical protein